MQSAAMIQGLKLTLAPVVWKVLCASWRMDFLHPEVWAEGPVILACLHRDILPTIVHVRPARPFLLVSPSPDGDILVRTLGQGKYGFIRGATGDGGGHAFREMVRCLAKGQNLGIAVDGPKGPFGTIQDGVLTLARLTGAPIVPLVAEAARRKVLDTWDRTVVPYPGARVAFQLGPKLFLARDAGKNEMRQARRVLQAFFGQEGSTP